MFKLNKALYGLKQAPRAWYERLTEFLIKKGYKRGRVDKTLFVKHYGQDIVIAQIYVDDIVFGSTLESHKNQFITNMEGEFEMSMVGELNYFLGLQTTQLDNGIFVSQSKYAKNLVKRFGLEESKVVRTPVPTTERISKDLEGKKVEQTLYRSMIGGLLYLTASRPDLNFGVGICARYQANPTEQHLKAVKRIIKYVKGTTDLGIWYSFDTNHHLSAYCDAD
ncbi:PREDICTED: uncharacterized protein LOC109155595 [Ipomoea nil]|uniref:uncharacterized protein LOC109155595 n=1 Tax=Ipomoea nil TaxID=35883 RepID=UPI0009011FD6|nr:PREDICTED: uncharacterized protein LOC109155595 [Ipomoea nil]